MKKINILILGGGMYVSGRGTDNFGTIVPAILDHEFKNSIKSVTIFNFSYNGQKKTKKKLNFFISQNKIPFKFELLKNFNKIIYNTRYDAAFVALPDHLHFEYIKKICEKKIHVISVKPFVTKIFDALELIRIQKKNNLIAQVDFHKRNDEANLLLKNFFREKKFGLLNYITIEYSQPKIIPEKFFVKWSQKTNVFQYLGVHYVDLIYFLTNAKPVSVYAVSTDGYLSSRKIFSTDSVSAIIEWVGVDGKKFNSTFNINWTDPNNTNAISDQRITVYGTSMKFKSDQTNRGISIYSEGGVKNINPYFTQSLKKNGTNEFSGYGIDTFKYFLRDVINFNKKNLQLLENSRATFQSSLISVAVTEAVNKSLKSGKKEIIENTNLLKINKILIAKKNLNKNSEINLINFFEESDYNGISMKTLKEINKNKIIRNIKKNTKLDFSYLYEI